MTNHLPADPNKLPKIIRKLDKAPVKALNERIIWTTPEIGEKRLNICKNCASFEDWACKVTNNFMPKTTRLKGSGCPRGYWGSAWGSEYE